MRALTVIALALSVAACHDTGDVKVTSLVIQGNHAFPASRLKTVFSTQVSSRLPWGTARYFDRAKFEADLRRLKIFYADRGYPNAIVSSIDVKLSNDKKSVSLTVQVDEGAPLVVERVDLTGFDVLNESVRPRLDALPLKAGAPRDREYEKATQSVTLRSLRNRGYAYARVDVAESPGADASRVVVSFSAVPGPLAHFGEVTISGLRRVHEDVVRRTLTFKPGGLYREGQVTESQRRLLQLEAFQFAHLAPDPKAEAPNPVVPIVATFAEARPQRLQVGIGYGTEEHVRGSAEWKHVNLFGDARELAAAAKYSSLLRGGSLVYTQPYFLRPTLALSVRGSEWRTYETTYTSRRAGGQATLLYRFGQVNRPQATANTYEVRLSYVNEAVRYAVTPEALADLSTVGERIALGLDPVTGSGSGTIGAMDVDFEHTNVDNNNNPRSGHTFAFHGQRAAPYLGGTFQFDELTMEGRAYLPIGKAADLAGRVRFGTIVANDPLNVPFSSRYFLGGSTSLRGWGRYEVAPLSPAGLPVGGQTLMELSGEIRFPLRGQFGAVFFVDAGNVWPADLHFTFGRLRADAGPGLRWSTPVGVVRADVGFQLTPIAGLLVNGLPETRRWRVHFSIGHAF